MFKKIKHKIILTVIKIITLNYLFIKRIIHQWAPKDKTRVLDLGCGLGNMSTLFSPKGYLGVDLDPESIEIAKQNYPKYSFLVDDITKFSSKDRFDLVTVIGVFHHINDHQMVAGLKVIGKHLKKTGRAIILEAIPPLNKWNIVGKIIRSLDQ